MGILTFPPNLGCTCCTRVQYTCCVHVSSPSRVRRYYRANKKYICSNHFFTNFAGKKRWQLSHNRRRFVPKTRKFLPSPVPDRPHFLVSSLIFRFFKAFFVGCCSARLIVGPFIFLEDFLYYWWDRCEICNVLMYLLVFVLLGSWIGSFLFRLGFWLWIFCWLL